MRPRPKPASFSPARTLRSKLSRVSAAHPARMPGSSQPIKRQFVAGNQSIARQKSCPAQSPGCAALTRATTRTSKSRRFISGGTFQGPKRWRPRRLTSAPASIDTVAAFRPWRDFRPSVARGRRGHHRDGLAALGAAIHDTRGWGDAIISRRCFMDRTQTGAGPDRVRRL